MITKQITLEKFLLLKENKLKNKKIVFTNGCFDIIHSGHISYLYETSKQGDVLVLGLNSDSSIKKIKGNNRPICNEEDRIIVLSAISFIDYIIVFDEDTPYNLIKNIKPDILVKGADYKVEEIVGYDILKEYDGKIKTITFVEGKSTSLIIDKIKKISVSSCQLSD